MIERSKNLGRYMALSQCGFEMVAPCIGGIFLDNWLGTMPVFTIILLILGFVGGLWHIVILSNQIAKADEEEKKAKRLVISETATGTYHYHLRLVGPEGTKPGGGAGLESLCGKPVGWDTNMPLEAWGTKDDVPSHWCSKCAELALDVVLENLKNGTGKT